MTDVHSKEVRSYNMSRIRAKDTKPEMKLRKYLFNKGFRYRIHDKKLPGKPDIVLPKYKTAIFVNGCFWHGHSGCRYFVVPKTRTDWWLNKINKNSESDSLNSAKLLQAGWNVITVFECELKRDTFLNTMNSVIEKITDCSSVDKN